jgi:biopolymer transport protein ExbD
MAKRAKLTVKEDVTCNLIPMVDIMFLLLLFFILGADMSQREQADVILPEADQVKEDPNRGNQDEAKDKETTINIQHSQDGAARGCAVNSRGDVCRDDSHWVILIRGREYTWATLDDQIEAEAAESMESEPDPVAGVVLSGRKITIRADRTAKYGDVQQVIQVCSKYKIYKIEVAAAKPPAQ